MRQNDFMRTGLSLLLIFGKVFFSIFQIVFYIVGFINKSFARVFEKLFKRNFFKLTFHFFTLLFLLFPFFLAIDFFRWYAYLFIVFGSVGLAYVQVYNREKNIFGDARFAKTSELLKAGLVDGNGIVLGRIGWMRYLATKPAKKPGHVLLVGGSGSGKSKSIAIPTLYSWEGSALVIDIKGELAEQTAQKRPNNGESYVFNPASEDCAQYDPIRFINGQASEAQEMARILLPAAPNQNDPFWTRNAQSIASAAFLEGYYRGATLQQVAQFLTDTEPAQMIQSLQQSRYDNVRRLISSARVAESKTLSGIMSELLSHMTTLAADEGIQRATSGTDWTSQSLEEKATIYLSIPEHLIDQYANLFRLILNQIVTHLTQRAEGQDPPILLLLDEFAQLGHVPKFQKLIATLRSRNVHVLIGVQSLNQLDEIYGSNGRKIIADNCDFKFVLGATDPDTQEYFSRLSGFRTVKSESKSVTIGNMSDSHSQSESQTGVPLIRPERFSRLEKPILFAKGLQPAEIKQAWIYTDSAFREIYESTPNKAKHEDQDHIVEFPIQVNGELPGYMQNSLDKALEELRQEQVKPVEPV